uniref:Gfo/Idh/MocA-like oxidoreductase domain containing 1 n=1 Tax=Ovis aries TaxID=9940 RepID=A0AC11CX92_SHEEP
MLPGVGVFGTSLTARVIIPLLKDEGFAVKALWGRTQEEAEELAKEMSVPFYTSRIDEVLLHQDVDLVCINLPPPLTRQIAVKTLGTLARAAKAAQSDHHSRWRGRPVRGSSRPAGVNHTDIKAGGNLNKEDPGLLGSGMHVPWAESWFTRCTDLSLLR